MRRSKRVTAGLVAALVLAGSACGGDDEPAAPAANGNPQSGAPKVRRFLMRNGEQPGFRRDGDAFTVVGVNALADHWRLEPAAAEDMRDRGFVSFTSQRTVGADAGGVNEVLLFTTPEGARDQMEHDLRATTIHATLPDTKITRFTVPDVPGARGWTGTDLHDNPIGTVQWVQGRCLFLLVSEGELPFVDVLSTGAQAIYERTGGDCP